MLVLTRQKERGGQEQHAGDADRDARIGDSGQGAPQGGQYGDRAGAGRFPGRQNPPDPLGRHPSEALGREQRVEHTHAGDQDQCDGDDQGHAGVPGHGEEQPDGPQSTRHPGGDQDAAAPVGGFQARGGLSADESADAGQAEREPVLPGRPAQVIQQQDGRQRLVAMISALTATVFQNSGRSCRSSWMNFQPLTRSAARNFSASAHLGSASFCRIAPIPKAGHRVGRLLRRAQGNLRPAHRRGRPRLRDRSADGLDRGLRSTGRTRGNPRKARPTPPADAWTPSWARSRS